MARGILYEFARRRPVRIENWGQAYDLTILGASEEIAELKQNRKIVGLTPEVFDALGTVAAKLL